MFQAIQQASKLFADTQEVRSLFGHQVKPSRLWGPLSRTANKLLGVMTTKQWQRVERYNMYYCHHKINRQVLEWFWSQDIFYKMGYYPPNTLGGDGRWEDPGVDNWERVEEGMFHINSLIMFYLCGNNFYTDRFTMFFIFIKY